jgi:hypothetical protein
MPVSGDIKQLQSPTLTHNSHVRSVHYTEDAGRRHRVANEIKFLATLKKYLI